MRRPLPTTSASIALDVDLLRDFNSVIDFDTKERTVLSILECPSKSCTALRLPLRRQISTAFVRRSECVPNFAGSGPMLWRPTPVGALRIDVL